MSNSQNKDNLTSNLRVENNAVIGNRLVAKSIVVTQEVNSDSITTANFQLTQPPLMDFNILASDDAGVGTWTPASTLPGVVTGSGTTGRIINWVDGPASDIGDTALAISAADITVAGGFDFSVTAPAAKVILNAGGVGVGAVDVNASSGGIALDAAAASNFSTTIGTLSLDATEAGLGGVVALNSAGTGAAAIDLNATAGGISADAASSISLDAAAASNFSTTIGTLSLDATEAGLGGVVALNSAGTGAAAIDLNSTAGGISADAASSISLDAAAASNFSTTIGTLSLDATEAGVGGVVALNSAGTGASAIDLNATAGGISADAASSISLDAAAASNFSTTIGSLSLDATEAGLGGVLSLNSAGTGVAAIDLNATAGGITVDYVGTAMMPVTAGGTIIATFGTSAAPDLTINNGDLVITGATRGLVHSGTGTVTQAISNSTGVTLNTTTGKITMFGIVALGGTDAFVVTNSAVTATSVILVSVEGVASVSGFATNVSTSSIIAGSFTLNVTNGDALNATVAAPIIHFMVINP